MLKCCKYWLFSNLDIFVSSFATYHKHPFPKPLFLGTVQNHHGAQREQIRSWEKGRIRSDSPKSNRDSNSQPLLTSPVVKNKHGPAKSIPVTGTTATKLVQRNKYFELKKTRGAAAPTRTTCSSSQLLVRVVVHQDHVMSVY